MEGVMSLDTGLSGCDQQLADKVERILWRRLVLRSFSEVGYSSADGFAQHFFFPISHLRESASSAGSPSPPLHEIKNLMDGSGQMVRPNRYATTLGGF